MTVDNFKALYPDFSQSYIDEQIGSNLRLANLLINNMGSFGDLHNDAIAMLTAHLLAIDKMAGKNGNGIQSKTSKRIGEVSFTYSQGDDKRAWLNLTSYGQKLLFLMDSRPKLFAGFVV